MTKMVGAWGLEPQTFAVSTLWRRAHRRYPGDAGDRSWRLISVNCGLRDRSGDDISSALQN